MPPLVWIDLEMTGLDLANDHIIEVAVLLTDDTPAMRPLAEDSQMEAVVHQPLSVLNAMGEWCKSHHGTSGLTQRVLKSTTTIDQAEQLILDLFARFQVPQGEAVLCGNSVHVDRQFLCKEMPRIVEYLHYRIIDVSTVKELCRRWHPAIAARAPPKKLTHRALDDILESAEELRFYQRELFIKGDTVSD